MNFISKSEFRLILEQLYEKIEDFKWTELISLSERGTKIPADSGVLILKIRIAISSTYQPVMIYKDD